MSGSKVYDQVIIDIKDYVYHYKIQSPNAFKYARIAILDAIGCAIETLEKSSECRRMLGPLVPGTVVPNGFRLPGTSYQLDPVKGAFDLGTMIRFLDHNDAVGGADWGHPSDNLGAILAISDWLCLSSENNKTSHNGPPLTINTLLEAMIKAYEIQGCFLLDNAFNAHGLDHVILVKLASTAVVSWILGLSEDQAMAAISHVFMDSSPLRVYRSKPNTIPRKGWAAGDACMRALHFSLLTQQGQPGAPTVLTAPRWGFYSTHWKGEEFRLSRPYGTWTIENTFFKVIAAEGHGISAIEAALIVGRKLAERGYDAVNHIKSLKIRTNGPANMIINKTGKLVNAADRDHCMQYLIAVVLLKGCLIEPEDYQDSSNWATDERVERLRERMVMREDLQFTSDYLDQKKRSISSGLTVVLEDDSELEEVLVEYPIGHQTNPLTLLKVDEKFARTMGALFSESERNDIRSALDSNGSISSFVTLLVRINERENKL